MPFKLPDAIIQATAQIHQAILITRNRRDFPKETAGVRIPYAL
jgi:predicted nucleic acid-binding protein